MPRRPDRPLRTLRPQTPPKPPDASAWESAELLRPEPSTLEPPLVSDGAGLPFAPSALDLDDTLLPGADPAVDALLARILEGRPRRERGAADPAGALRGWRVLARTADEVLFGGGMPPTMLTAVARAGRRGRWAIVTVSRGQQLRAFRGGARASSFRLDPDAGWTAGACELRLLVLEQTHATGKLAHGRFLTPELFVSSDAIVLRMFVQPIGGFQNRSVRNPETPVRVALPEPVSEREVVDGAVFVEAGSAPTFT